MSSPQATKGEAADTGTGCAREAFMSRVDELFRGGLNEVERNLLLMRLKDQEHLQEEAKKDILPPSKPIATFYLVDEQWPLRKQLYLETLQELSSEYTFSDLCGKLKPTNEPKGEYCLVRTEPPVYMYVFDQTKHASKAKVTDFAIPRFEVASRDILPEIQGEPETQGGDAFVHAQLFALDKLKLFNVESVLGLLTCVDDLLEGTKLTDALQKEDFLKGANALQQEVNMYKRPLKIFSEDEGSSEVAVNSTFLTALQKSIFRNDDFHVGKSSIGMMSRHVTKYGTSLQDLIIYHKKNYMKGGRVTGAVVNPIQDEGEEQPIESAEGVQEGVIVGSAYEFNWGQLVANMVKLAGQLCERCILEDEYMLIKDIKIYGALIEVKTSSATPACLHIWFNKSSKLSMGSKSMTVTECMHRTRAVLSA